MKNKVNSKLIHISLNKFKFVLILVIFLYSNLSFAQTPTSADNTVSINEDNDKVFIAGDFSYSDPNGDPFTQIMITGLESTGTLFYDADNDNVIDGGENVVINQIITVPNIPRLKFRPNSNESGVSYDSFDFQINDGNDGNSALSYTMTIDIILVNDEPSFTLGANQTVNEDVGAQTVAAWATVINRGAPDEAAQTLTFHLT
ncbi:MAG: hypothetical protein JXR51_14575, partial [Bacteroidales bacterium]|nr:hypothetical protein [Bacteroidales bacterium]